MAISTYKVFLMKGAEGSGGAITYEKLLDIKDFPNLGGEPEAIETTTLSNGARTYIQGIQSTEALPFTANYTKEDFEKINTLAGNELNLAVWFGGTESGGVVTPTGSEGKFSFKGTLSAYVNGGGVNEVVDMTVTATPSTVITFGTSN